MALPIRRPLRVAHLDHSVTPGGAELALARIVAQASWRSRIAVPRQRPDHDDTADAFADVRAVAPHEVVEIGAPQYTANRKSGSSVSVVLRMAVSLVAQSLALVRSRTVRGADVVHANSTRAALYAVLPCMVLRKPLVVHVRDLVTRDSLGEPGYTVFTRVALRRADAVIANSRSTLASIPDRVRPDIAEVIMSPLGLSPATAPVVSDRVQRIGMVARLSSWKGQDLAIRAFAREFAGRPVELHFAGGALFADAPDESLLTGLAETLRVADQVHFHGQLDDIGAFIDGMDVCLHASTQPEPLGQTVLQYLLRGRPTIAVNAGGPAEWIVDGVNGLLFEMRSEEDLARAFRRIAPKTVRETLAAGAIATQGILSDVEVAELHRDVFERALRKRPPNRRTPSKRAPHAG